MSANNRNQCTICGQHYSITQKMDIKAKIASETLGKLPHHPGTCLTCIQESLSTLRDTYLPDLINASAELAIAQRAYKEAIATKQYFHNKHRDADQQRSYIKFFLQQANEKTRAAAQAKASKPRKAKASKRSQADVITALLNSLTPEQQALIAEQAAKL